MMFPGGFTNDARDLVYVSFSTVVCLCEEQSSTAERRDGAALTLDAEVQQSYGMETQILTFEM